MRSSAAVCLLVVENYYGTGSLVISLRHYLAPLRKFAKIQYKKAKAIQLKFCTLCVITNSRVNEILKRPRRQASTDRRETHSIFGDISLQQKYPDNIQYIASADLNSASHFNSLAYLQNRTQSANYDFFY